MTLEVYWDATLSVAASCVEIGQQLTEVGGREDLIEIGALEGVAELRSGALALAGGCVCGILRFSDRRCGRELLEMPIADVALGERLLEALGVRPGILGAAHASALAHVEQHVDVGSLQRCEEALARESVHADGDEPAHHGAQEAAAMARRERVARLGSPTRLIWASCRRSITA